MKIREFHIDDYDAIINLWTESSLPFKPNGRDQKHKIKRELNVKTSIFLIAEIENKIVGSVFGTHDGRKGWINRLAILPDYRGQGIAKKLVFEVEERLSKIGIEIIACLVENYNDKSMEFFKTIGYIKHNDIIYFSQRKNDKT